MAAPPQTASRHGKGRKRKQHEKRSRGGPGKKATETVAGQSTEPQAVADDAADPVPGRGKDGRKGKEGKDEKDGKDGKKDAAPAEGQAAGSEGDDGRTDDGGGGAESDHGDRHGKGGGKHGG